MRKNKKTRKRLTYHSLKQVLRLMVAFFSSFIIIVNCKEEEKRQMEAETERMEAFFEDFDENVETLAINNIEPKIGEDLFENYTQKMKFKEYELAIEEYSLYFNLDSEKVFELTKELTNDFSESLTITIEGKTYTATNAESTAIFITYDVWKDIYNTASYKKKYNLKKEDYITSEDVTNFVRNDKGEIIMRNGLTFHQLLAKVSYAINKSPDRAASISDQESGHRTSKQARTQNNVSGIKGNGISGVSNNDFITFPSIEAGTIYHVFNLERMENITNYNNLYQFAIYYVWGGIRDDDPEKEQKLAEVKVWYQNVSSGEIMYAANEEYYFGIPEDEEKNIKNDIQLALMKKD